MGGLFHLFDREGKGFTDHDQALCGSKETSMDVSHLIQPSGTKVEIGEIVLKVVLDFIRDKEWIPKATYIFP